MTLFTHLLSKPGLGRALAAGLLLLGLGLAAAPAQAQDDYPGYITQCLADADCPWQQVSPMPPAPPPKPDVWGALALSASTLHGGFSLNQKSEAAARDLALQSCLHLSGGARDCRVVRTVADLCLAVALSRPERVMTVGGPTGAVNFAENNAMLNCRRMSGRSCTIAVSFCADGVRHVLNGRTIFSNGNPIFVPEGTAMPYGRR